MEKGADGVERDVETKVKVARERKRLFMFLGMACKD